MQALNFLPDGTDIPLVNYQNGKLFTILANQSLPKEWRLQLEKLSS